MRRVEIILVMCCLAFGCWPQTQQGVVKTKGRMVNGKHVAGQGLSGATVTIQGRSAVLSLASGAFSFPVTNKSFMVLGVKKQGYQLVDADATRKAYQYSPNTFYVLMETPEQQAEDKLSAERKIRRTLQRQLQQREDELEELKEQNKLTQEEYQKKLQQLYDDQQNNEKLIADMAKEYSQMDYDQMDELNRQISDAILNGELTRADSLLRSKGDIGSRVASLRKAQEAEIQREAEIAKEQEELAASKAGTKKRLEDLAQDCKNYFDRFKMSNQHDSAAYYIELRAGLDTMNVVWQSGAGFYYYEQNQYKKSEIYLDRALAICHRLVQDNPQAYEPYMANTLNNLANLYRDTQRFSESEEMFKEALEIYRRLAEVNPQAYEPYVATALHNLANLYRDTQRFPESESMYKEALAIRSCLAESNPQAYEPDVASTLNNLAVLYNTTQQTSELESVCKELRQLYTQKTNREYKQGSKESAEKSYKNVVVNNKRLIDLNFESYIYDYIQSLSNYVLLAAANKHFAEAYQTNKSDFLPIYKKLSDNNPERFGGGYSKKVGAQAFYAIFVKQYAESEQLAREGLSVDSTQHRIACNLAAALLFQGKYAEAESIYRQYKDELKDSFLDDFKQFAEAGVIPPECEADVEKIKKLLNE